MTNELLIVVWKKKTIKTIKIHRQQPRHQTRRPHLQISRVVASWEPSDRENPLYRRLIDYNRNNSSSKSVVVVERRLVGIMAITEITFNHSNSKSVIKQQQQPIQQRRLVGSSKNGLNPLVARSWPF